jgi:hypothetical protein
MFLLALHLVLLLIASVLFGWPITVWLTKGCDLRAKVFWSALTGQATLIGAWTLDLALNSSGTVAGSLLLSYLFFSWSIMVLLARKNKANASGSTSPLDVWRAVPELLLCLGLTLVAASPTFNSLYDYTTPLRIGPDAIGNAVAAQTIADGKSLKQIEEDVLELTDSENLGEVLDFETHKLYETLDLRAQIRTEFLVAGLRWGYPASSGSLLKIWPEASPWAVLPLTSSFGIYLIALGSLILARLHTGHRLARWVYISGATLSPLILNSWHEGGASQIFGLPAISASLLILTEERARTKNDLLLLSISLWYALTTYSDLWVLICVLLVGNLVLARTLKRSSTYEVAKLVLPVLASLLFALPFSVRFVPYIFRRLNDAAIGGWYLPHWMSPIEIIGLVNAFSQPSPSGLQPRTNLSQNVNLVLIPIVLGTALGLIHRTDKWAVRYTWYSATALLTLIYLKTRYIDGVSNYQYFKAAGCLLPAILLPLIVIQTKSRRTFRNFNYSLGLILFLILVIGSAVSFARDFRRQSFRIDKKEIEILSGTSNRELLERVNLVAPLIMRNTALSVAVPFNWFGRGAFGLIEGDSDSWSRPLYLLVRREDCIRWACLSSVSYETQESLSPDIRLVQLSKDSRPIQNLKESNGRPIDIATVVSRLFTSVGGRGIGPDYRPLSEGIPDR